MRRSGLRLVDITVRFAPVPDLDRLKQQIKQDARLKALLGNPLGETSELTEPQLSLLRTSVILAGLYSALLMFFRWQEQRPAVENRGNEKHKAALRRLDW